MSNLFTKAANVKTTTKLWIVGIALLIMVNIPYTDNHYQPSPIAAPLSHPPSAAPLASSTVQEPEKRSGDTPAIPATPSATPTPLSSVTGNYTGTVHNATAAVSANFAITLEDSNGALSGSMTVKPPLYGSGPLQGSTNGAAVVFTVTSSTGKIVFTGSRSKRSITGSYTVTQPSGGMEKGTFTLDRTFRATRAPAAAAQEETTATPATLPDVRVPESFPTPRMPIPAPPVQEHSDPRNLSGCLSGYGPCNHNILTPAEALRVATSEKVRNLSACMSGYGYCNHSLLTAEEVPKVNEKEKSRNLSACMSGYGYCNHALLTTEEVPRVADKEKSRNLSACMSGYGYCNHSLLTPEELPNVTAKEKSRNFAACMSGYGYCSRTLLTPEELMTVQAKEHSKHK